MSAVSNGIIASFCTVPIRIALILAKSDFFFGYIPYNYSILGTMCAKFEDRRTVLTQPTREAKFIIIYIGAGFRSFQ